MSTSKLRVLALMHRHLIPPETIEEGTDITAAPWRTEYDVVSTLTAMGHEVRVLGVHERTSQVSTSLIGEIMCAVKRSLSQPTWPKSQGSR